MRWVDRVGSLFPRYLFLHLEVGEQVLAPVRSTLGVAAIVRFGCEYAVVPDQVVEDLRMSADPGTGLHRLRSPPSFAPGTRVRIVAGAFDGVEGVFLRESGDERVVVLLKILGQSTPARIPAASLLAQSESRLGFGTPRRLRHAHG